MFEFREDKMKKIAMGILMGVMFLGMNIGLAADFGSGVVSVSPAAVKPTDYQYHSLNWYASSTEAYYNSGYPESAYMEAPVYLPNMATITGFSAVVTDNGSGADDEIWLTFRRHNMTTGVTETIAFVSTTASFKSSARQTLSDSSLSFTSVDNDTYTYSVLIRFYIPRSYIKFHGVKIQYWSVF